MDDILDGLTFDVPEPKAEKEPEPAVKARTYERGVERHHARRYFSEKALDETLPWHFEPGDCYHIISGGDIDSLTYLRAVVRQQPIEFMLLSTWCMAITDLEEIHEWMQDGYIGRVDFYVGEIFPGSYAGPYNYLKENCIARGGRCCVFRNHSKVMAGYGKYFDFVIESSANVNTNPRTEQTCISIDTGLADFYKEFYDGIKSFTHDYTEWKPYRREK